MNARLRVTAGLAVAAVLGGCAAPAGFGPAMERAGFASVASTSRSATGANAVWLQTPAEIAANSEQVAAIVRGKTISADTAVQVALLNNRALQAAYADLGISAAEAWQAALLPNPVLHLGVLGIGSPSLNGYRVIEGGVAASVIGLTTRKQRSRIAELRFRQAQLAASADTLRVAAEARRAWIEAVAAFEQSALLGQAQEMAAAGAELAQQLGATGALNRAGQARELALAAELEAQRARARLDAQLAKERLTRAMGLFGADLRYFVPDALPPLPHLSARENLEAEALAARVDLAAAALELEAVAQEYRLADRTRVLSDIDLALGVEVEREEEDGAVESAETVGLDAEIALEIPVFDNGAARLRQGEAAYMRAAHLLALKAVEVRSEAREAHVALVGAHRIAQQWEERVLPLRRTIEEEALLSYNGMITSTFDLLADTRGRLDASLAAAAARADYWMAEANVTAALYGGGAVAPAGGGGEGPAAAAEPGH
ncbi:TolC family protein [Tranquillimonas alkanivorans]|uniref:Outer membrane protein TolC n=1 Tax=Tranquillimonas alkanivorans TaxID=441119 RepID=A0A1I5V4X8_9RHOB|nr:TolC family protein [Tranquillimonas alkanivorans]SFQ02545.1 Outer membrane protein TolC [Tranquillimonas alkanivorans]